MADIRCPMCGRPNPPDLEVCGFCQARLKPMVIQPFSGDGAPIQPGETPVPRKTSDLEPNLPDWLRDLRGNEDSEEEASPGEDLPDWLSEKPEEASASQVNNVGDDVDWLRGLRDRDDEIPLESQESLPDWLSEASEPKPASPEDSQTHEADWWARVSQESVSKDEATAGETFQETPSTGPEEPSLPQSMGAEGQPEKVEKEDELPDWLKALSSEDFLSYAGEQNEDESPGIPPAVPAGEEPDWLHRVRARQQSEDQPPTQAFLPDDDEDIEEDKPSLETPSIPRKDERLPDWLSSQTAKELEPDASSENLPDWFSQVQETPAQETPAPDQAEPGFLAGFGTQAQDDFPWTESTEPEEQTSALDDEAMPEWLKKLEASAPDKPAGTNVPAFVTGEEAEFSIDQGKKEEEAEIAEEASALPNLSTLPEWISQVTTEAETPEGEPVEEEPSLAPAQLPNWLEAMRPVEAVAPAAPVGEEQAAQVEKIGPLAGLRGVIPAEPLVGHLRKPPAYSVKLQVSETQNRNALLLQKLLESEGQAQAVPGRGPIASQAVLRLVIAVALALAVLVPLWLKSQDLPFPDPTYVPDGVIETLSLINVIVSDDPVLVAIDYEPGLSAEMEMAASTMVKGLASRGASLALVSTNPAGPLLAERLMNSMGLNGQVNSINYINLGFIAGGPMGLLSFANHPRETLPFDLGSSTRPARVDVWDAGALGNIQTVADFAMLMVITENPDTARYWIEQVQPLLQPGNVPLVMVVSAQAEPLVRPYFDAYPQQVNGLVAGLNGIATYDRISGQSGPVRLYWDAFGAGLLVIEALILVGGLINLLLVFLMPRKGTEVEGTP